jgi:hypothetical protein
VRPTSLLLAAAAGIVVWLGGAAGARAADPIQIENALPGTPGWYLPGGTPTQLPTPSTSIEGYLSSLSVAPGDTLGLHVSTTPAASYRVEIFRLGWYHGLGGRLIACLPSCQGSEQGQSQPVPAPNPQTGYVDAGWPVTDSIAVSSSWVSGYFVAKLILTSGPNNGEASWVPFIVRSLAPSPSAILVQASVNTWEAYNKWGGKSLYSYNSSASTVPASQTNAAAIVSFQRPFASDMNTGPWWWEYDLVRFLERDGYDVSYQTDIDTDENPSSLLGHRLDIVSGHDEYWSPSMRDAYDSARAAGVNLAFIGGNIGAWQARYGPGDQSLIEYRSARLDPDPVASQKTVMFARPPVNRPQCQLLGTGIGGLANLSDPPRSFVVTPTAASTGWLAHTGLLAGSTIFDSVGYEWDAIQPGCAVPPLTSVLHFPGLPHVSGSPAPADAVTYTAPSGARVFSAGSLQLVWALDDFGHTPHANPGVQRLFQNILSDLGSTPPSGAPTGEPAVLVPAAGAFAGASFTLVWSDPVTVPHSYQIFVDGQVYAPATAPQCSAGRCSAPLTLAPGRHTLALLAVDPLLNYVTGPYTSFVVDSAPPSHFRLLSPRPRAWVCTSRLGFYWSRARDPEDGVAYYAVLLDGRRVTRTHRLHFVLRHRLRAGRHRWTVIAVDRAGNARFAGVRTFRVCS